MQKIKYALPVLLLLGSMRFLFFNEPAQSNKTLNLSAPPTKPTALHNASSPLRFPASQTILTNTSSSSKNQSRIISLSQVIKDKLAHLELPTKNPEEFEKEFRAKYLNDFMTLEGTPFQNKMREACIKDSPTACDTVLAGDLDTKKDKIDFFSSSHPPDPELAAHLADSCLKMPGPSCETVFQFAEKDDANDLTTVLQYYCASGIEHSCDTAATGLARSIKEDCPDDERCSPAEKAVIANKRNDYEDIITNSCFTNKDAKSCYNLVGDKILSAEDEERALAVMWTNCQQETGPFAQACSLYKLINAKPRTAE